MEQQNKKRNRAGIIYFIIALAIIMSFNYVRETSMNKEISYTKFQQMVKDKQISKVIITNENLIITPKDNNEYKGKTLYTANISNDDLLKELNAANITVTGQNPKQSDRKSSCRERV